VSNTLLTVDMVTREALRVAHETAQMIPTVDRQYDSSYGQTGAKIGSVLRVRRPNQYLRTTGSRVMDVQDQEELASNITLATQDHVDMRFNSAELALSIDDFSKRYIEPAVKELVGAIEGDAIAYWTKQTYNTVGTTTIGTLMTDLTVPGLARARLNQHLAPKDNNRFVQLDSYAMSGIVNGLKGLFHDGQQIREQYREGMMGRTGGADWYENDRVWSQATSADVSGTTDVAAGVTDGGETLSCDTAAPVLLGTANTFTIAGVYACHPETKQSLGFLRTFINTAGTGATDITVSPKFYLTGAKQNVCSATSTQLATTDFNSKAMVPYNGVAAFTASKTYPTGLMYHKEAFQFVTADLPIMDDAARCVRRSQDGLSLRVWQASDIRNDEMLMRIDILYGMAALRPEWACRMVGQEI
jgi:P22 coat protein - gene protein 5